MNLQDNVPPLQKMMDAMGFKSMRAFAKSLEVNHGQVSRWLAAGSEPAMSVKSRLALARLIGKHCDDEVAMEVFLQEAGWTFDEQEYWTAVQHLQHPYRWEAVPRITSQDFIGRELEITALKTALLKKGGTAPLFVIIQGLPGVGKTTLVARTLEETEVQERFPDAILWLDMISLAGLHSTLHVEDTSDLARQALVAQLERQFTNVPELRNKLDVLRFLKGKRVLLVLDSVEDCLNLDAWRMVDHITGRIIITTRRVDLRSQIWDRRMQTLTLKPMAEPDAQGVLLRGIKSDLNEHELQELLKILGGLPLALTLAHQLAKWDAGFRGLLPVLRQRALKFLTIEPALTKEKSVRFTFEISYSRLTEASAQVFRFLSFVPQPARADVVAHVLQWDLADTKKAFQFLVQLGLVEAVRTGQYRMHPLLYEYAKELLTQDQGHFVAWKERFVVYIAAHARQLWETWLKKQAFQAMPEWRQEFPYIDYGYRYAIELQQGEHVLDYLLFNTIYLGAAGLSTTVDEWHILFSNLPMDEDGRAIGYEYLGQMYALLLQYQKVIPLYTAARQHWESVANKDSFLRVSLGLILALIRAGRISEAIKLLNGVDYESWAAQQPLGEITGIESRITLAEARKAIGQINAAFYCFAKALESVESKGEGYLSAYRARILIALGEILPGMRQSQKALSVLEEGMQVSAAIGYDLMWCSGVFQLVRILVDLGQLESARTNLTAFQEKCGEDPRFQSLLPLLNADVLWASGEHEASAVIYHDLAQAAHAVQDTGREVELWAIMGNHWKQAGEMERAVTCWLRVRKLAAAIGHGVLYLNATLSYGLYLRDQGQPAEAQILFQEVINKGEEWQIPNVVLYAKILWEFPWCKYYLESLRQIADTPPNPSVVFGRDVPLPKRPAGLPGFDPQIVQDSPLLKLLFGLDAPPDAEETVKT